MKKTLLAAFIFSFSFFACDTEDPLVKENCIQVRLVKQLCGQAVIQVLSPEYLEIAEATWVDGDGAGTEYKNVFGADISCDDFDKVPEIGEVFFIRIVEETNFDCARCEPYVFRPETRYSIKIMGDNCSMAPRTDT